MQILFVDDDYDDFEMFAEAMKTLRPDADCIFQHTGEAALNYLRSCTQLPDYIFLDLHMPVMAGIECLEKVKANEKLKDIPTVMYSSDSDPRQVSHCRELGANHFLTKPSTFQDIIEMLKVFFSKTIL